MIHHPPINREMIHLYASLCHHLFEVPVTQGIAAIPLHIQQDDFGQEVSLLTQELRSHLVEVRGK